jgi:hypothetical protein
MIRRLWIPGIIDLLIVNDLLQIRELNDNHNITREVQNTGPLLNRLVARRIGALRVDGQLLPTFTGRLNTRRAEQQRDLEQRLTQQSAAYIQRHQPDIEEMAAYVVGLSSQASVEILVQQLVGRMFFPDYMATERSYRAAKTIETWLQGNRVKAFWLQFTGQLRRSKRLISELARGDLQCIHATSIALHNIVATLKEMRKRFKHSDGSIGARKAIWVSLNIPKTLVRWAVAPTSVSGSEEKLNPGTLIILRLANAVKSSGDTEAAFAIREWNQCPAHAIVLGLFEEIWAVSQQLKTKRSYQVPERPIHVRRGRWTVGVLVLVGALTYIVRRRRRRARPGLV